MWLQFFVFFALVWYIQRWLQMKSWNHFKGFGSLTSLPIIGHSYKLNTPFIVERVEELCLRFGSIFRLDIGPFPTVIMSDFDEMREMLRSDAFNGRHFHKLLPWRDVKGVDDYGNLAGVASSSGAAWKEQRRFMQMQLGDLGLRKTDKLVTIIGEEANKMTDIIERSLNNQEVMDFSRFFLPITNNIIWRLLTGKATNIEDPEVKQLSLAVGKVFSTMTPSSKLNIVQMNSSFFYKMCKWVGAENVIDASTPILNMIAEETKAYHSDPKGNYIERNLAEIQAQDGDSHHISHGARGMLHMRGTIFDLFLAGTDTTATLLEWILLYLADRPDLQEKLYSELKDKEQPVTTEDKMDTPLTVAVIEETLRMCPMGSGFGLPHMVTEDTHLAGHFFPKGTHIFPFVKLVHRNPKYFEEPDRFLPERFIDKETGEFKSNKYVVTFSAGKRRCPGEQLARTESYVFLAALIKKFTFHPPQGGKISFDYNTGLALYPKYAKLQVSMR